MVCKSEDDKGRWTCAWCSLRVCKGCRGRLKEILAGKGTGVGGFDIRNGEQRDVGDRDRPMTGVGSNGPMLVGQRELMKKKI